MLQQDRNRTKFRKFKRLLRPLVPPGVIGLEAAAVGVVECLIHLTMQDAPRGDLGAQLDNADIAEGCAWEGDAEQLVAMLVESGWLVEHPRHRLVLADWHAFAPNFIKGAVARHAAKSGGFASAEAPEEIAATPAAEVPPPDQAAKANCQSNVLEQAARATCQSTTNRIEGNRREDNLPPPPPTSPPAHHAAPPDSSMWEEEEGLAAELASLGVNAASAALKAARGRGLTAADVRALAAEFRTSGAAYGPGALYRRLTGELATWPVAESGRVKRSRRLPAIPA
jgi:hypothetical protein